MSDNQDIQVAAESVEAIAHESKHGGARRGAGRPDVLSKAKWFKARGIDPLTAAEIIDWHGEQRGWKRLLATEDDRVFLQAWLSLVAWRDGKPAQKVNVTGTIMHVTPEQVESAMTVAHELRMLLSQGESEHDNPSVITPVLAQSGMPNDDVSGEQKAKTMLPADEGAIRVVDRNGAEGL